MKLIQVAWLKFCSLFRKNNKLASTEEEHWVYHIFDETISWPNKAMMWANVHGFNEGPDRTYWIGVDVRSFGIRVTDYVLKFHSQSLYYEFLDAAKRNPEHLLYKMREDSRLTYRYGDDVNIEFVFKWSDEEKTFDVRLSTDSFAIEK